MRRKRDKLQILRRQEAMMTISMGESYMNGMSTFGQLIRDKLIRRHGKLGSLMITKMSLKLWRL